jgi:hypothetical protein
VTHYRLTAAVCETCTSFKQTLVPTLLKATLAIIFIIFQLHSAYDANLSSCMVKYLSYMNLFSMGASGIFNDDVYIKLLVNHFQVSILFDRSS